MVISQDGPDLTPNAEPAALLKTSFCAKASPQSEKAMLNTTKARRINVAFMKLPFVDARASERLGAELYPTQLCLGEFRKKLNQFR
jgi:hypothetical protein